MSSGRSIKLREPNRAGPSAASNLRLHLSVHASERRGLARRYLALRQARTPSPASRPDSGNAPRSSSVSQSSMRIPERRSGRRKKPSIGSLSDRIS